MSRQLPIVEKIAASFGRQGLMQHLGARLLDAAEGRCVIELAYRPELSQQHGYFHAGAVAAIADTACGYAALSLMPDDASVLTVEFKVNLLRPAEGDLLRAVANVKKAGRTLTVASATVEAVRADRAIVCAELLGTLICLRNTPDA